MASPTKRPMPDKDGWVLAAESATTPDSINDPQVVIDPIFRVTDIPTVMRDTLNWPKSSELMELWFSLPAREMTEGEKEGKIKPKNFPPEYINTTMFTWEWLDQFEAVKSAVNELLALLRTTNAERTIKSRIKNWLAATPESGKITAPLDPVLLHSDWQFQKTTVGYDIGKVDDLYGSLGNFGLYTAITKCTVKRSLISHRRIAHIQEIGIYMKDTYDFREDQYLGHWGFDSFCISPVSGVLSRADLEIHTKSINIADGEFVDGFGNADYQEYRKRTSKGGDLLLFSNIKTIPVEIVIPLE